MFPKKFILFITLLYQFYLFPQNIQNQIILDNKPQISKIKDLTRIIGYKNNQLMGYGVVIGLKGTGDSRFSLSREVLSKVLQNLQIQMDLKNFEPRNIASVMVTAEIPPFAKKGDRITCFVSSIGDAKSIQEGILLQTPLYASNGKIYAVAQGKLIQQSFDKNPNSYLLDGAIVERDLEDISFKNQIRLQLLNFDLELLHRIHNQIQTNYSNLNPGIEGASILLNFENKSEPVKLLNEILNLDIEIPVKNKIFIHQQSRMIIISGDYRLSPLIIGKSEQNQRYEKIQKEAYQGIYIRSSGKQNFNNLIYIQSTNIQDFIKEINQYQFNFEELVIIIQSLVEMGVLNGELYIR